MKRVMIAICTPSFLKQSLLMHPVYGGINAWYFIIFQVFLTFFTLKAQPDSTFKKILVSDKEMIPVSIEAVPSGGFIVGGLERGIAENDWSGFMLKLTEKGETEWKRTISSDTSGIFQAVKPSRDGGFIGTNNYLVNRNNIVLFTGSALTWCKTNATGILQWSKNIKEGQLQASPAIDIEEAADGSIYTVGYFQSRGQTSKLDAQYRAAITKMTAQGNLLWQSIELFISNLVYFDMTDLLQRPDKDLLVIGTTNTERLNNFFRGTVLRIGDENGTFTAKSAKAYVGDNIDVNFKKPLILMMVAL